MVHDTMFRLRVIRQIIFPRRYSVANGFEIISSDVIQIILSFLSIPDQVCFSLSCKFVLACFRSFLKRDQMKTTRLLPKLRRPIIFSDTPLSPRAQLLRQLQNDRWIYCSHCSILHPYSIRGAIRSIWRLPQVQHYSKPRGKVCDLPYIGIVDICPCLSITFYDKLYLIEALKPTDFYEDSYVRGLYDSSFGLHPPTNKTPYRVVSHHCTFADHPSVRVLIETLLWINEANSLQVSNKYRSLRYQSNNFYRIGPKSISICTTANQL